MVVQDAVTGNSKSSICKWRNSNTRIHNDSRDVRFLAIARSQRGVPVSVNSPRLCSTVYARFFRCDVTDVLQTALAIILAINVNFTSVILRRHVRQGEVPCSFRSFRRRTVSMYNRR